MLSYVQISQAILGSSFSFYVNKAGIEKYKDSSISKFQSQFLPLSIQLKSSLCLTLF